MFEEDVEVTTPGGKVIAIEPTTANFLQLLAICVNDVVRELRAEGLEPTHELLLERLGPRLGTAGLNGGRNLEETCRSYEKRLDKAQELGEVVLGPMPGPDDEEGWLFRAVYRGHGERWAVEHLVAMLVGLNNSSFTEHRMRGRINPPHEVAEEPLTGEIFFGDGGLHSFGQMLRVHQLVNEASSECSGLQQAPTALEDMEASGYYEQVDAGKDRLRAIVSEIVTAFGFELKEEETKPLCSRCNDTGRIWDNGDRQECFLSPEDGDDHARPCPYLTAKEEDHAE